MCGVSSSQRWLGTRACLRVFVLCVVFLHIWLDSNIPHDFPCSFLDPGAVFCFALFCLPSASLSSECSGLLLVPDGY